MSVLYKSIALSTADLEEFPFACIVESKVRGEVPQSGARVDYCEKCRRKLLDSKATLAAAGRLSAMLRGVGYWRESESEESDLPHPKELVTEGWRRADRDRILAYLRAGQTLKTLRGFSFCRFDCGVEERLMGFRDLTDGSWVWPEGLPHYVERHCVCLPDEFLDTMEARHWRVPGEETLPSATVRFLASYNLAFWIAWARLHKKQRMQA